jgi:site-specific DNA recombinase
VALPRNKAFAFHVHGQWNDQPFHMSLVTSRFNGPYRQDAIRAIRRLYTYAKFLWWDFAILNLNLYSIMDAQQIERISHKVFEAQKGRVLDGNIAGSWPYGYRPIIEQNTSLPDAIGRAATGTRLEVVEKQAEVVRRIFQLYADGYTLFNIAVRLNKEGIPRDSQFRSRGNGRGWPPDAIKRILHNEKYRGVFVWNRSCQLEHPVTGKVSRQTKPAHDHITVDMPHLRIVSDELWNRAADRLKQLNDKQEARKAGGYNRAKDRAYLYSGLLFCGSADRV